ELQHGASEVDRRLGVADDGYSVELCFQVVFSVMGVGLDHIFEARAAASFNADAQELALLWIAGEDLLDLGYRAVGYGYREFLVLFVIHNSWREYISPLRG